MTGGKKSNSESVIHFQINEETKCAGNASQQLAAPAAAVVFFIYSYTRRQKCCTHVPTYDNQKYMPIMHVAVTPY